MTKKHKLTEQELFDLMQLQQHVIHWNTVFKTKVGFLASQHGFKADEGKLSYDLIKGELIFEPKSKIIKPR